jgi:hypothetical protein
MARALAGLTLPKSGSPTKQPAKIRASPSGWGGTGASAALLAR